MYELVTGEKPFSGDYDVLQYAISPSKQTAYFEPVSSNYSIVLQSFFVHELLKVDPEECPSAKKLRVLQNAALLRHAMSKAESPEDKSGANSNQMPR